MNWELHAVHQGLEKRWLAKTDCHSAPDQPYLVIILWMSTEKKHRMTTMALMDVPLPGFDIVRGQQLYDIECCPFLLFSWWCLVLYLGT